MTLILDRMRTIVCRVCCSLVYILLCSLLMLDNIPYFLGEGDLVKRGHNKLLGPESEAYWRGRLIERGAKKRIYVT